MSRAGERGTRLLMHADLVHEHCRRFVHSGDLDRNAVMAKFQHHSVQCVDAGDVPEMRCSEIDDDGIQVVLAEIEGGVKGLGRGEKICPLTR